MSRRYGRSSYRYGWYVCLAIYAMEPQGASSGGGDLKGFETLDEVRSGF